MSVRQFGRAIGERTQARSAVSAARGGGGHELRPLGEYNVAASKIARCKDAEAGHFCHTHTNAEWLLARHDVGGDIVGTLEVVVLTNFAGGL